jgi:hypothetical protein
MVAEYAITVFFTQLVFIAARTWNVKAIAKNSMPQVLLSGTVVHLSWLLSIAIGSVSMYEIIESKSIKYLPVIACSLSGGLIGSWIGLQEKRKKI